MVGFGTVDMMRNASRQKKAETAAAKTPASQATVEKPVTNTSGTATDTGVNMKQVQKQILMGARMGGTMGAAAGFLGIPFTKSGTNTIIDPLSAKVITPGLPREAPRKGASIGGFAINPAAKKEKPTNGTGIDAPAPDTGWRPSGTNSALGLQQTQMGVPLQETIGVSKRKR